MKEDTTQEPITYGQIRAGAVTTEKIAVATWTTLPDGRVYYNGDLGDDIKHFRSYEKIAAFRKIPLSLVHDLVKRWEPSVCDLIDVIRFDLKCDKVRSNEEMFEQAEIIKHIPVINGHSCESNRIRASVLAEPKVIDKAVLVDLNDLIKGKK